MFNFLKKKQKEEPTFSSLIPMEIYSISLAHIITQVDKLSADMLAVLTCVHTIAMSLDEMPVVNENTPEDYHTQPVVSTLVKEEPIQHKNKEFYINQLEYARDMFTKTVVEKNAITKIINNIKENGTKHIG